jgi:ribosomal protein S10
MNNNVHLIVKASNLESLILYKFVLKKIFQKLNLKFISCDLPKKKSRITLNKSPHVNKTAREQFEICEYSSFFYFSEGLDNLSLKYIFLNKPKTAKIKIKTLI